MRILSASIALALAGCTAHAPASAPAKAPTTAPTTLRGTTWRLVDLSGAPALGEPLATISFPEEGRVAGAASCNRFFGGVQIAGDTIAFGALGSTRMACGAAIMDQEGRYLAALGNATRYAIDGSTLSIWVKGSDAPLRFTRQEP